MWDMQLLYIACQYNDVSILTSRRMGELEPWIDENFIRSVWYGMGETVNVKMIRDKFSGYVKLTQS